MWCPYFALPFIVFEGLQKTERDETTRNVVLRTGQRKREQAKERKRERERRRKQRVEKKKQKGGRKRSSVLCGRAPTSSKHERANNRSGARVYPPLFGPCEEACGHVSPRIPGDRIKRGRRKGSREGVCELEREGSGDSRKGGGEEAPVKVPWAPRGNASIHITGLVRAYTKRQKFRYVY